MIASAKWHVYKTAEDTQVPTKKLEFGPGTNSEACTLFFGGMMQKKKKIMGTRPYLYLHMLHTDPEYQGRGAGGALLEWGKDKADELGLPIYLESSTKGHKFYRKHGFKDIEVLEIDFTPYGGSVHRQPLMMREVSGSR
ncbi:hypothetical protein OPT61_g9958 [Boeremia exigua]|uniref:Uncharacterized protein n=1 Tax=Boeremia exigua TaxID=749465 RepID=A0ACC2HS70_9PLEO|nr:hypothetical protein OPT61_g9958 [Boeremia exigua]